MHQGKNSSTWSSNDVIDWAISEGRLLPDIESFVGQLGGRLVNAGARIDRIAVHSKTLHPELVAHATYWTRASGKAIPVRPRRGIEKTDRFLGSPLQVVFEQRQAVRQDLTRLEDDAHSAFTELVEDGYSDYLALPIELSDNLVAAMIFVTQHSEGFSEDDCLELEQLVRFLIPIIETFAYRLLTRSLLNTYVGQRTGQKVLTGMIQRGDAERINAALWFSDLRDFTLLSETLPAEQLLQLLNSYFETVAAAVTPRGGEILRFIGDAMLIVFPIEDGVSAEAACNNALESAFDVFSSLAPLNHLRNRRQQPSIQFGVGLNIGEVIYGNVGARDRLDFTVMGPAVNRTARLEALTKSVGETILVSKEFADRCSRSMRFCGAHQVKGIAEPLQAYCPA